MSQTSVLSPSGPLRFSLNGPIQNLKVVAKYFSTNQFNFLPFRCGMATSKESLIMTSSPWCWRLKGQMSGRLNSVFLETLSKEAVPHEAKGTGYLVRPPGVNQLCYLEFTRASSSVSVAFPSSSVKWGEQYIFPEGWLCRLNEWMWIKHLLVESA